MSEDSLDHIKDMPFTMSQIEFTKGVDFVHLSGDRVYSSIDKTLYVYYLRYLTHPIATYQIDDKALSA